MSDFLKELKHNALQNYMLENGLSPRGQINDALSSLGMEGECAICPQYKTQIAQALIHNS